MTPPGGPPSDVPPDDVPPDQVHSEQDTGQPIRLLLQQELEPSHFFMQRVRGKIYRRTATSQLASYS